MYWYKDPSVTDESLLWAPCKKVGEEGDKYLLQPIDVRYKKDKPFEINKDDAEVVDPSVLNKVGDLLNLGAFDEGSLLHTIRDRFFDKQIYTSVGPSILLAVNPYQKIQELFNTEVARKYRKDDC